jgi:hypothetical protein
MGKYIPGNPTFIVQNMPGAGSLVAANHVYGVAKPDGLTLGLIAPALYFNQLVGRKEVQFDWSKLLGSVHQSGAMRCYPCGRTPAIKASMIFARLPSRPDAELLGPAHRAIIFLNF